MDLIRNRLMDRILAVDQKPTLIETIRTKLHKRNNVDIANHDANWNQLTAPRGCSLIDFTNKQHHKSIFQPQAELSITDT